MRVLPFSPKAPFTSVSCKEINWHAWLGHPSDVVLQRLAKHSDNSCSISVPDQKCIVCPLIRHINCHFLQVLLDLINLLHLFY